MKFLLPCVNHDPILKKFITYKPGGGVTICLKYDLFLFYSSSTSFHISVGAAIAKPLQDDSSTNTCQTEINNPGSDQVISNNPENSSENSTPVKSTSKASTFFNTKMSSEKKAAKTPEESDCK